MTIRKSMWIGTGPIRCTSPIFSLFFLLVAIIVLVGFPMSVVHADTLITSREGSNVGGDAQDMRAGDKGSVVQLWSRSDRMARIGEANHMIGRLDRGESYMINDAAKTCSVIKHKNHEVSDTGPKLSKTGQTRQIGPWKAVGYEVTVAMGDSASYKVVIWVSDEVTLGLDEYRSYTEGVATQEMSWMNEALTLGGYPVRQEVQMGHMTSWSEIVSVEDKSPPAGVYEKPDGYSGCD